VSFLISKFQDDENLVFGFANVSVSKNTAKGDGGQEFFDLQKDAIPPAELEKAAYNFVLNFREADEMHKGDAVGHLVESMVFTPEKLEKLATDPTTGAVDQEVLSVLQKALPPRWWVGFKLSPTSYQAVKSGKYTMFSIAGQADRDSA
jgi:hypothetical protein